MTDDEKAKRFAYEMMRTTGRGPMSDNEIAADMDREGTMPRGEFLKLEYDGTGSGAWAPVHSVTLQIGEADYGNQMNVAIVSAKRDAWSVACIDKVDAVALAKAILARWPE